MKDEFNAASTPLEDGFTMIEASAGTGKTTTISTIVLRLLLEGAQPIEKILIATYTELATAELRGRIREIIQDALGALRGGEAKAPYVAEIIAQVEKRDEAIARLEIALRNFDLAAIFTIHGFCARVLSERAFESGAFFDLELTTDQSRLVAEIADDFWRTNFSEADPTMASALRKTLSLKKLTELLLELTTNPRLKIIPPAEDCDLLIARLRDKNAEREGIAERLALALQVKFSEWAKRELLVRKAARGIQSFDDLLTRLDEALSSERGRALCARLREAYPVALIDEFQDTDPVQYSILRQIYGESDAQVFLIGDPKQAIYGFRGADVFSYLAAAKIARRQYTLGRNWRSEEKLVDGVSALFQQRQDAFVIEAIDFPKVRGEDKDEVFTQEGRRDPPLRWWIARGEERASIERRVAQEIARLLSGGTQIGEGKLAPRDIVLLINANSQAAPLQRELARFRLPTVVYTTASVFKSREAAELLRVMRAIAQPGSAKLVRSALATEMLGFSASDLDKLREDELAWEGWLNRFADYHLQWRDGSFIAMMRAFLAQEKVRQRLLVLTDGERRLTNVLHLLELLHLACAENRFGLEGLTTWLRRQTSVSEPREEYELRLESDEDALRIVTIHKSKGLEYGVTFYPYARREPWAGDNRVIFHEEGDLVLDLAKAEESRQEWHREKLAEAVRQVYVGLTRARHRSYVVWRDSSKPTKSALAWMLEKTPFDVFKGAKDTVAKLEEVFAKSAAVAVEEMPALANVAPPQIFTAPEQFSARKFSGEIDRSWGLYSFSGLAKASTTEPETPDYDTTETPLETEPLLPAQGIHSFPGGTRAGTCLHKILEQVDFQNPGELPGIVAAQLEKFQLSEHRDLIARTMAQLLDTPLAGFSLREIAGRLPELEFTFPITGLTAPRLQEIFGHGLPAKIGTLQFQLANGFMKGFIDLFFEHEGKFYFADWKSNWLGPDDSFYRADNLAAAMTANFYWLQLSIYAVALHRFLQKRVRDYSYEKNFGGAFYVFLRGLESETRGILAWRPPLNFIEALDGLFYGKA
ncbi:MAG: UvrD-helicase domain-containing protein [Verrucomicrobiota bacterium]